jgi:TonB family protein
VAVALQVHAAPSGVRAKDEQDALALSPAADQAYGPDFRGRHISDDIRELVAQFGHEGTSAPGGSLIPDPKNLSQESRRRGEEGIVMVKLHVSATGCAGSAAVSGSTGFPDLDAAVMKFYETLTFLPAQENGAAVEAVVNIPVNFKLDGLGAR